MEKQYVLVFIIGSGVDKAMCVALKNYPNDDHDYMLAQASRAGVMRPEIVGQADIPRHLADEMVEGRIYVG